MNPPKPHIPLKSVTSPILDNRPARSIGIWVSPLLLTLLLSGCSTAVAVADAVGSAAVYTVKTVVNTVDAVTPDIVNGDDDDDD